MCTLHDTTHFDMRIDCSSTLAYVACQVLTLDQPDCMIIMRESHMSMCNDEDNRQWVEAIGVANAWHTDL